MVAVIEAEWNGVAEQAGLTEVDRDYLWRRQFLNPYALPDYGDALAPKRRDAGPYSPTRSF